MISTGRGFRYSLRAALAISLFLITSGLYSSHSAAEPFLQEGAPNINHENLNASDQRFPNFARLAHELSPSVVNITVEPDHTDERASMGDFPSFGEEEVLPFQSLGSGFIVSADGYIVTNNHVVGAPGRIVVRLLNDPAEYVARIVGRDSRTDLALIKIEPEQELPPVFLGDSDQAEVGAWVLAIGNQFQLGQTVTAGIISAKARRVRTPMRGPYDAFIQTDASINPGSSGGPLFNTQGQVIGIATAIFSPGRPQFGGAGFNIGIGFAIPINLARDVVQQLRERGRVVRGLLGVIIQPINPDIAEALGLATASGALVSDVMDDSPAAEAGFQRGDVIVRYNANDVTEHEDLPLLVANTPVGSEVLIDVIRGNRLVTLSARIAELTDEEDQVSERDTLEAPEESEIGVLVEEIPQEILDSLNIDLSGVIAVQVVPGSPAHRAGVTQGDIIKEVAGVEIENVETFNRIVADLDPDRPVLLLVRKPEGSRFLTLRVR